MQASPNGEAWEEEDRQKGVGADEVETTLAAISARLSSLATGSESFSCPGKRAFCHSLVSLTQGFPFT